MSIMAKNKWQLQLKHNFVLRRLLSNVHTLSRLWCFCHILLPPLLQIFCCCIKKMYCLSSPKSWAQEECESAFIGYLVMTDMLLIDALWVHTTLITDLCSCFFSNKKCLPPTLIWQIFWRARLSNQPWKHIFENQDFHITSNTRPLELCFPNPFLSRERFPPSQVFFSWY